MFWFSPVKSEGFHAEKVIYLEQPSHIYVYTYDLTGENQSHLSQSNPLLWSTLAFIDQF